MLSFKTTIYFRGVRLTFMNIGKRILLMVCFKHMLNIKFKTKIYVWNLFCIA
jgi:hypothetical protein